MSTRMYHRSSIGKSSKSLMSSGLYHLISPDRLQHTTLVTARRLGTPFDHDARVPVEALVVFRVVLLDPLLVEQLEHDGSCTSPMDQVLRGWHVSPHCPARIAVQYRRLRTFIRRVAFSRLRVLAARLLLARSVRILLCVAWNTASASALEGQNCGKHTTPGDTQLGLRPATAGVAIPPN